MIESLKPIINRMLDVWTTERRPVTYRDFIRFELEGNPCSISHTNFRNKIHELIVDGIARRLGNSFIGQYLLTQHFDEYLSVTENHMGVNNVTNIVVGNGQLDEISNFWNYIHELPSGKQAIHDIHTMHQVPSIYDIVSRNPEYSSKVNPKNKGIMLDPSNINGTKIQKAIYPTDTVTVIVGCSSMPVPFNEYGMNRLSHSLSIARDELSKILSESADMLGAYEANPIPDTDKWSITLWHFGWDKAVEYPIKDFEMTWYDAKENLNRFYLKKINGNWFKRSEVQVSPRKPFGEITDGVKKNSGNGEFVNKN